MAKEKIIEEHGEELSIHREFASVAARRGWDCRKQEEIIEAFLGDCLVDIAVEYIEMTGQAYGFLEYLEECA
jgi:hypothetical protein